MGQRHFMYKPLIIHTSIKFRKTVKLKGGRDKRAELDIFDPLKFVDVTVLNCTELTFTEPGECQNEQLTHSPGAI